MDSIQNPSFDVAAAMAVVQPALSAIQLGSLFTWGLHGVLCVQVYNYYLSFPNDPSTRKAVVYLVFILETVQLILVTRDTYEIFTLGFGNYNGIGNLQLLPFTIPILGGIIGIICHLMFAYRVALVSESKLAGGLIALLAMCSAASSFAFGGKLFAAKTLQNAVSNYSTIYLTCGLWNGFGAGCDVLIAACMTFYLSRAPTGFKKTDLFITRIIRLTIETGIVTATSSIASVTLFVGFRRDVKTSVYFILPAVMIAKLYSITILATFNNRPHAVGGPPTLPDTENSYDTGLKHGKSHGHLDSNREIRIGRTVVEQVWTDDIPMSTVDIKPNPQHLISSTMEDTRLSQTDLTKSITRSLGESSIYSTA